LLQGFAGVTLQLKTAELALPTRPDVAADTIVRVQQLARESLREARERVWEMRGIELANDDVATALEAMARERTTGTHIDVCLTTAGRRRRLPRDVEDAAIRIGREATANAVQPAEPRRIEIHVGFGDHALSVEIRDDGRGLLLQDAEAAPVVGISV
jgi:signal transduction histidine kinase